MSSSRRHQVVVALTGVFLAVCPAVLVQTPASAAYGRVYAPEVEVIKQVPFRLHGFVSSPLRRTVNLQARTTGGSYTTIATATTTRHGRFTFTDVVLTRRADLRVVAAPVTLPGGRIKPVIVTGAIQVRPVTQTASISVLPPIVQRGTTVAAPPDGTVLSASFAPARPGRRVVLQRKKRGQWRTVGTGVQDRAGFTMFTVPPAGVFRAVASETRRVPAVSSRAVRSRDWVLDFEDTFSGPLNEAIWKDQTMGYNPAGGRVCSKPDPSVRWVEDGALRLSVAVDPARVGDLCAWSTKRGGSGQSPYLLTSQVATVGTYGFTHGFAAARMRLQSTRAMHSAFWVQATDAQKVPGRPDQGVEVDVVEYFGDTPRDRLGAFVHVLEADGSLRHEGGVHPVGAWKPAGDGWATGYHVFSVEWTPTEYVFRVDGREFWRHHGDISQAEQYLVLSLLTSDYQLPYLTGEALTQSASVDWVRVWRP